MNPKYYVFLILAFCMNVYSQCPIITVEPQPYSIICDNETFTVSISAVGTGLSYQWYVDGEPVSGQNSPVCAVLGVNAADAGGYYCVVSKTGCAPVMSEIAMMVVTQAPYIMINPQSEVVTNEGGEINLSVLATGSDLSYQWVHNGADIPDAITPQLSISPATIEDSGQYMCIVGNDSCPSAFSGISNVEVITLGVGSDVFKQLQLYPNPASDNVYFQFGSAAGDDTSVKLFDIRGKKIMEAVFTGEEGSLDISRVQAGIYFTKIVSGDKSTVRKLVVN